MRHRRTWSRLVTACAAVAALAGCIRDKIETGRDTDLQPGVARVHYEIEGDVPGTRATPTLGHERRLKDVHLIFFAAQSDGQGKPENSYVTYQHASVTAGTSSFTFPVPEQLRAGQSYKVLVVGNSHDHVPQGYTSFDDYLEKRAVEGYVKFRESIYAEMNMAHQEGHSTRAESDRALPMWGKFVDGDGHEIPFKFEQAEGTGTITISGSAHFSRSVCRLDLNHLAAKSLIIESVKICNFRKQGRYFSDIPMGPLHAGLTDARWVAVSDPSEDGQGNKIQSLSGALYTFPNINPVVVQNDDQTTYLMIKGYYQDGTNNTPDKPKQKATYYRFNLVTGASSENEPVSQILKRNNRYVATINSVKGPGADDEQGANDAEAPMLDYVVDDSWEDSDGNTATDDKGNFLTVSKSMVKFDGYKDLSESVRISLKEGLTWKVEFDNSLEGNENSKFTFARIDDRSFSVSTKEDNATDFTRLGRLKVKATGGTVSPSHPLIATVNLYQFSSKEETATLMVDGKMGTIEERAAGAGSTLQWQVETGSLRSGWIVTDTKNNAADAGVRWSAKGANRGMLEISVPTNISAGAREFEFKVQRTNASGEIDGSVNPVIIKISQPKSDYLITVSPSVPSTGEGLVLEGFSGQPGTPNGISTAFQFRVLLADPSNYTWTVSSTFNKDHDAVLSKTNPLANTTQAQWQAQKPAEDKIEGIPSGETIWLNVFRTGPGDPTITGSLSFTAVPNSPAAGSAEGEGALATQTVNVTVSIRTTCEINDVFINDGSGKYLLVADRNVGAQSRIQGGKFVPAGNFSNVPNMHITNKEMPENKYEQWRGRYFNWATATGQDFVAKEMFANHGGDTNVDDEGKFSPWYKSSDISKWVVPSKEQLETLNNVLCFSKGRPFLVSVLRSPHGQPVACYLPIAGYGSYTANAGGYYWSTTEDSSTLAYYWSLSSGSASIYNDGKTYGYSVRCVRSVAQGEVQHAPRASHAWVRDATEE